MAKQAPAAAASGEVAYPTGFASWLAPVHLAHVCSMKGVASPPVDGAFRYCEIGCGTGLTVNILAAANPEAAFLGIDLAEDHIDEARAQAARNGLENADFLAADIAGEAVQGLAPFDYITMHGLYAWVSPEVRQAIVRFLAAKLRPGGLILVSYNTLPGWASVAELRRYFLDRIGGLKGSTLEKTKQILDELVALRAENTAFFAANPSAADILQRISEFDIRYVAHEFLAQDWRPARVTEVAADMAGASLTFVGEGQFIGNRLDYAVPRALHDRVAQIADPLQRESVKDFVVNRFFRGDVYRRPDERSEASRLTLYGMDKTPAELADSIDIEDGRISLEGPGFEALKQVLSVDALMQPEIAAAGTWPSGATSLDDLLDLMTIGRQLRPFARRPLSGFPTESESDAGIQPYRMPLKLNREMLNNQRSDEVVLASPVVGSGVVLPNLEATLLRGLLAEQPIDTVLAEVEARGIILREDEVELTDAKARRAAITGMLTSFVRGKLPKLCSLGLVVPLKD